METILHRNLDMDGAIAGTDTMGIGALKAGDSSRRSRWSGFDDSPDGLAAVNQDELLVTVL